MLSVEEVGKALSMMVLALAPQKLRGQVRVGRLLEWHSLKLAGGLLAALVPPGVAAGPALAGMPHGELKEILRKTEVLTQADHRLKQSGLYVDMDKAGCITEPTDVAEDEVSDQLSRTRQAVATANALLEPSAPARLASPPQEAVEFAEALVAALADAGPSKTPEAAAPGLGTARLQRAIKREPARAGDQRDESGWCWFASTRGMCLYRGLQPRAGRSRAKQ